MPNWRKLITSGSDAYLNSLNVSGAVTASFFTGSFVGDGSGLTNVSAIRADNTVITVKNISGAPIQKGTPLYLTGSNTDGNLVGVFPADAGNILRMPVGAIAGETLADEAEGFAFLNGFINEVNTTTFNSGDTIYVGVGGGYTNTRPTGSNTLVQKLGNVERVAVNGSGVINGPGYYNDLPNIEPGYYWAGNNDGVAVEIPTSSLFSGSYSGSFQGDGSQLTGITVDQITTFKFNFTNQTSVTVPHTLDTENLIISVYDQTGTQIIPDVVKIINESEVLIEFIVPTSGYIVLVKGGHIVTDIFPHFTASFNDVLITTISHSLYSENISISVYDSSKSVIIPQRIQIINPQEFELEFIVPTSGYVVVTKGGHIVSGSIFWENIVEGPSGSQVIITDNILGVTGSISVTGGLTGSIDFSNIENAPKIALIYTGSLNTSIVPLSGSNESTGDFSTVAGGVNNISSGQESTVGGGVSNQATENYTTISGGRNNRASALEATVGGGGDNLALGDHSTVLGGFSNIARANTSTVVAGSANEVTKIGAVIVGGNANFSSADYTFIGGGADGFTPVGADYSVIVGGFQNTARGVNSGILGGGFNEVRAVDNDSFIIGSNITSNAANTTFVNNLNTDGKVVASSFTGSIDFSNIENIVLPSTQVFVGNASGIAQARAVSGDATLSNTGVLTISNNAVTTGKIADLNVTTGKIADDAVDNTKLSNMAANTIKGRITAGIGNPEDLTAANVRTIINVADGANNYVHPSGFNSQPASALTGANVISQVTVNGEGHVTGVTSRALTAADLSALTVVNLGYTPSTSNGVVTNSAGSTSTIPLVGGNAGLMSPGDKTKLDGVATSANNYVHPSGFSSQPASALTGANVISQVTVNGDGHVTGVTSRAITLANLGYSVPNLQSVTNVGSTTTNSITAANFITTSDRRVKSEIEQITNPFETLDKINSYEYIKDGKKEAGFIAQEVQEVIPYAVFEGDNGMLTMSDRPILAYLFSAVMELKEENKILKEKLEIINSKL